MTGIYKITNKLNNKSYIGQARDIEARFKQHQYALINSNKSWYPEARLESNSLDDFDFLILQECSVNELDELEEYWINYYDSYNNGYNKTKDGQGLQKHNTKIIDFSLNTKANTIYDFQYIMSILNGNAYKLYHYFYLLSLNKQFYPYSRIQIQQAINVGKNGVNEALKELIAHHIIILQNDRYFFYRIPIK